MRTKKTALLTGATGFIGSHLARRLLRENFMVNILTSPASDLWRIQDILPKLHNHQVDLTNFEKLKITVQKIKPDYIIHCAAAGVGGGKNLPDKEMLNNNSIGSINLIQALNEIDYDALINTGSSAEYGEKRKPMKETDICEPTNIYAISKLTTTLYASAIAKTQSKPIITLRLFSPYGPRDEKTRLIDYAIKQTLANKNLSLGNPASVRDFIYIQDVIDAYMRSINIAKKYAGEVFNIGSGKETPIKLVVESVKKISGSRNTARWDIMPSRPWESAHWQADISKAKKLLGWTPQYDLNSGLTETINWHKKNQ